MVSVKQIITRPRCGRKLRVPSDRGAFNEMGGENVSGVALQPDRAQEKSVASPGLGAIYRDRSCASTSPKNWLRGTSSAHTMRTMFTIATFRSPRSASARYVKWMPARSASLIWLRPVAWRCLRIAAPRAARMALGEGCFTTTKDSRLDGDGSSGYESIDYKSTYPPTDDGLLRRGGARKVVL